MTARKHTKHLNHRLGKATRVFRKASPPVSLQTADAAESYDESSGDTDSIDESLQETIEVPTGRTRSKESGSGSHKRSSRSRRSSKTKSKLVKVECDNCHTLWQFKVRHERQLDCEECGETIVVGAESKSTLSKLLSKLTGG